MKQQLKDILRQVPWLGVGCILLAGVLISAGIVIFRQINKPEAPKYTVVFKGSQGTLLNQQQVTAGGFAQPPKLKHENDGIAFRCWSQHLYNIQSNTEVTPVYQDLRQTPNALYMDAQYARLGEEVTMPLLLGGVVRLSGLELTLSYDSDVLLDFRCDVENSPFQIVSSEKGQVTLRLDSNENLTETMTAATLHFKIAKNRDDVARTTVTVEMKDPIMVVSGAETGTGSTAIHGDIYILS